MAIKFFEDLVSLMELKISPGRVVKHTTEAHQNFKIGPVACN